MVEGPLVQMDGAVEVAESLRRAGEVEHDVGAAGVVRREPLERGVQVVRRLAVGEAAERGAAGGDQVADRALMRVAGLALAEVVGELARVLERVVDVLRLERFGDARWQEAVEAATREMNEQLRGAIAGLRR